MTRGLPGSGKTTWAREMQEANPNITRINNDDLRAMMHGGKYSKEREKMVNVITDMIAREALGRGHHVIIDNTHLPERWVECYKLLAILCDAAFKVQDFRDVPLETCLERNAQRPNPVPEKVIRDMWRKFIYVEPEPYPVDDSLPWCIIVDLDGTLARRQTGPDGTMRGPYDWDRVGEDAVDPAVRNYVRAVSDSDLFVFAMSARDGQCEYETRSWLHKYGIPHDALYMRAPGDKRKDAIVKRELFDNYIRGKYNVYLVLDDRQQVVDMWRSLGLRVWQVAEGNF